MSAWTVDRWVPSCGCWDKMSVAHSREKLMEGVQSPAAQMLLLWNSPLHIQWWRDCTSTLVGWGGRNEVGGHGGGFRAVGVGGRS